MQQPGTPALSRRLALDREEFKPRHANLSAYLQKWNLLLSKENQSQRPSTATTGRHSMRLTSIGCISNDCCKGQVVSLLTVVVD